ncbi:unnamed protein product [Ixodes pacificus]
MGVTRRLVRIRLKKATNKSYLLIPCREAQKVLHGKYKLKSLLREPFLDTPNKGVEHRKELFLFRRIETFIFPTLVNSP